jgi:hypothetical protein
MTDLERLFRRLVDNLIAIDPARLHRPVALADLLNSIIPYRTNRRALSIDSAEDYDMLVLRLCSGEGGYVQMSSRHRAGLSRPGELPQSGSGSPPGASAGGTDALHRAAGPRTWSRPRGAVRAAGSGRPSGGNPAACAGFRADPPAGERATCSLHGGTGASGRRPPSPAPHRRRRRSSVRSTPGIGTALQFLRRETSIDPHRKLLSALRPEPEHGSLSQLPGGNRDWMEALRQLRALRRRMRRRPVLASPPLTHTVRPMRLPLLRRTRRSGPRRPRSGLRVRSASRRPAGGRRLGGRHHRRAL